MKQNVITAESLIKTYDGFNAVDGISFAVEEQGFYGMLGPNGAGKSTTMQMIYQVTPVTSGDLRVLGMQSGVEGRAIRSRLGVIPQIDNLDEELTVRENLITYARFNDIDYKTARYRADEMLDFMELSAKADSAIRPLSGGMQRRLTLARGLMNNPDILILDEPTTGLDPQVRLTLWNKLEELRHQGVTILLSTHYMEEAERLTDYLYIMDHGTIRAEGAPGALVREHASRDVIEIRLDGLAAANLTDWTDARNISTLQTGTDRLIIYSEDGRSLIPELEERGISKRNIYHRPGNLEDVFLHLTGRTLRQ